MKYELTAQRNEIRQKQKLRAEKDSSIKKGAEKEAKISLP